MKCPVCEIDLAKSNVRNLGNHRRFFVFIRFVFDHQDIYNSMDSLRREIIRQTGRCDAHHHLDGSITWVNHSIQFGKMGENEFRMLFSDCINVVLKYFCKNMTEDELWTVAGF